MWRFLVFSYTMQDNCLSRFSVKSSLKRWGILQDVFWSKGSQSKLEFVEWPERAHYMRSAIIIYTSWFANNNQHGAQELLRYLLEGLHRDLNQVDSEAMASTRKEIKTTMKYSTLKELNSRIWRVIRAKLSKLFNNLAVRRQYLTEKKLNTSRSIIITYV